MSKRVFISYRREDTAAAAGRVYDRLCALLPLENAFIDVSTIRGGENFQQKTLLEIARSDVALVFIGKKWMDPRPGSNEARIWETGDYVREEVRSILNKDMLVLPVLVDGALMPPSELLPEDIRPVTARNALALRHDRFNDDVDNIFSAIFGPSGTIRKERKIASRLGHALLGLIIGLALLITAAIVHQGIMARPLAGSIGVTFTILLFVACTSAGAGLGLYYERRKHWR
jgi:TIR domain